MKMRNLMFLAVGLLLAADAHQQGEAAKDKEKLQGTWQVVSLEAEGEKGPAEVAKALKYIFTGDKLAIQPAEPGSSSEFTYQVDPTRKPKVIDMKVENGPDKGNTDFGIYLLDGDNLKICFGGKERPTAFESKPKSGTALVVLKREKP
jgi:uncharacterized protein (TIGR03067 family)